MHVMYGMVYLVLNTALLCSRESNQQKLMGGGSGQMVSTGPKSLLSQSYQLRMDRRYVSEGAISQRNILHVLYC